MNWKRILAVLLALTIAVLCAGCGAKRQPDGSETAVGEREGFPWTIELRAADLREGLHTAAGMPQYDGSTLDVDYDDEPADGCAFLILTFTLTKTEPGGGAFEWERLCVRASDGRSYSRMKDDAFLQNHTYNRIAGTSLMIGENRGSACFEIPVDVAKGELTLVYDAGDAGTIELPVRPE